MAGKDEKRVRSKTISFYVTPEENKQIQARIKIAGMPKGEYFIESLLHQKICISVGKYQSDRLSLEMKKLRIALENIKDEDEPYAAYHEVERPPMRPQPKDGQHEYRHLQQRQPQANKKASIDDFFIASIRRHRPLYPLFLPRR